MSFEEEMKHLSNMIHRPSFLGAWIGLSILTVAQAQTSPDPINNRIDQRG
jgi:hypothetical protein